MNILVKNTSKRLIKNNLPIMDNDIILDFKGNSFRKRNIGEIEKLLN